MGPLWLLWKLGLAPTKRQADFILLFIIVASSAWSYIIIIDYTTAHEQAFSQSILLGEVFSDQ
jgi:positive regulator of sigma E activity